MHRTLIEFIEKGMVRPSLDAPTLYIAVDLDTALDAALKTQESELRQMEARKRELQELSKQQRFRPPDDVSTFKIIKSVKELDCHYDSRSLRKAWILVRGPRGNDGHNLSVWN